MTSRPSASRPTSSTTREGVAGLVAARAMGAATASTVTAASDFGANHRRGGAARVNAPDQIASASDAAASVIAATSATTQKGHTAPMTKACKKMSRAAHAAKPANTT